MPLFQRLTVAVARTPADAGLMRYAALVSRLAYQFIQSRKVRPPADKFFLVSIIKEIAFFANEQYIRQLAVGLKSKKCLCNESIFVHVLLEQLMKLGQLCRHRIY